MASAICACALLAAAAAHALPEGAESEQFQIASGDGTKLDVDVIRKAGTPADERQPVILVVSPYTLPEAGGPSSRFDHFFRDSNAIHEGYTYVTRRCGRSAGHGPVAGPDRPRHGPRDLVDLTADAGRAAAGRRRSPTSTS